MLTIKKIIKYNLWVSSTIAIVVALVIIPLGLLFVETPQIPKHNNDYYKSATVKVPAGVNIKNGDPVVYDFLEDVKKTDGIVVLGTSETSNFLNGKNYYSLLNKDKGFDRTVYYIAGAGRTANMYFPLILNNPKAFDGLEIIYYINPTYWRKDLCGFDDEYFERYVDFSIVQKTKHLAKKKGVYNDFLRLNPPHFMSALSNHVIGDFKELYSDNLNSLLGNGDVIEKDAIVEKVKSSSKNKIDINDYYTSEELEELKSKINLEYNVTEKFLSGDGDFPEINQKSTYQYDLLTAFIGLCKEYNIRCTFYLGPYNEVYCKKQNPEFMEAHQQAINNIRDLLILNDVNYIDGSSLSSVTGTFSDVQHISAYGAYFTALQIKEYYEKND